MPTLSIVRRTGHISAQKSLLIILRQIKNGMYERLVTELRRKLQQGDKRRAKYLRDSLPGFTPAARFEEWLTLGNLKSYTQFIMVELVKLPAEERYKYKVALMKLPYTYACFENAPGNGLVVLTQVNSGPRYHRQAFEQVKRYYTLRLDVNIGDLGRGITAVCPYSYDPELFVNPALKIFPFKPDAGNPPRRIANLEFALKKMEEGRKE